MASQDRLTYYVQPAQSQSGSGWEVRIENSPKATETNLMPKEEAIEAADYFAENKWIDRGIPTQVIVRRMDNGWYLE